MDSTLRTPNRLIRESSPYLQQHAYNPVDWFPWSSEAFQLAKETDRPILVSIGYAACHWCHVMERESFEDETVATVMNRDFVCIKVDREEYPAVDDIYMEAVQAIAGNGGWPLNCRACRCPFTPQGFRTRAGFDSPTTQRGSKGRWRATAMCSTLRAAVARSSSNAPSNFRVILARSSPACSPRLRRHSRT